MPDVDAVDAVAILIFAVPVIVALVGVAAWLVAVLIRRALRRL
jgi:hypothetical protein